MKRPLAVICISLIIFLSGMQAVWQSEEDGLLLQTEQILLQHSETDYSVTVCGTVNACSRISAGVRIYLNHITVFPDSEAEFSLLPDTQITFTTEYENIVPGDCLYVSGELSFWESAGNPGQFDARAYYFSENTVCSLDRAAVLEYSFGKYGINRSLHLLKRTLENSFWKILDEKAAGTITAICLGEKGAMDTEWKESFQEGGIAHILAVSGLHITVIGMGCYRILRKCCVPLTAAVFSSGSIVFLYAWMTGFSVSAIRAIIMFLIWLGAQFWGRKYDMLTALSAAAGVLLVRDSQVLTNASFLLSFSAVFLLATLIPISQKTCMVRRTAGKNVLSGVLIWAGTLPVTLFFFYQTAPWSFLLNLLVVPMMSLIMTSGLAAAVTGCFWESAGVFLAAPVHYLLRLFEWLCQMEKQLPGGVWIAGKPRIWKIIIYYLMLLVCSVLALHFSRKKVIEKNLRNKIYGIRLLWITGLICCLVLMLPNASSQMHIICLDVGQGDGAILQMPTGEVYLVDGGSSSERSVWKYRIEKTLKYYGISQIDGIFLSHEDQDHISGIEEYLEEYTAGFYGRNTQGISLKSIYLPAGTSEDGFTDLKRKADLADVEVYQMEKGSRIVSQKGEWSIQCLAPDHETLSGDSNEDSMVLKVQYGEFQMLFTGDLEGTAEKQLVQSGADLKADVLKVGHHGSENGSSESFLEAVTPETSVISCGKENRYGHPAEETVERIRETGSRIFITADTGAVHIVSDGEIYAVYAERQ